MSNPEEKKCRHDQGAYYSLPQPYSIKYWKKYEHQINVLSETLYEHCPICPNPSPSQSCEPEFECFPDCGCAPAPTAESYKHKDSCRLNDKSSMTRFCDCRDLVEPSVEVVMLWSLGIGDEFTFNGNSFKVTGFCKKRTANFGTVSIMKTISDGKVQYFMRDHEVVRNERNRHG